MGACYPVQGLALIPRSAAETGTASASPYFTVAGPGISFTPASRPTGVQSRADAWSAGLSAYNMPPPEPHWGDPGLSAKTAVMQVSALLEELKAAAAAPLLSRCLLGGLADRIR